MKSQYQVSTLFFFANCSMLLTRICLWATFDGRKFFCRDYALLVGVSARPGSFDAYSVVCLSIKAPVQMCVCFFGAVRWFYMLINLTQAFLIPQRIVRNDICEFHGLRIDHEIVCDLFLGLQDAFAARYFSNMWPGRSMESLLALLLTFFTR